MTTITTITTTIFNSDYIEPVINNYAEYAQRMHRIENTVYSVTLELGTIPELIFLAVVSVMATFLLFHFYKWGMRL